MDAAEARDRLLEALDQAGAALAHVVQAYHARRTPERDALWLKLQAGKELNAMRARLRQAQEQQAQVERGVDRRAFARLLHETAEEMDHYADLADCLSQALGGAPLPLAEMAEYSGWEPHPAWPEHSARVLGVRALQDAASPWVRRVLQAANEGGDAAFHWAVAQLPPDDALLARVAAAEERIARDEVHHGPDELAALAAEGPSPAEVAEAVAAIRALGVLNARQRNEQFGHPLRPAELDDLAQALVAGTLPPLDLFRRAMSSTPA